MVGFQTKTDINKLERLNSRQKSYTYHLAFLSVSLGVA